MIPANRRGAISRPLTLNAVVLRLELSQGTTVAAEIGKAVVDLQLEVK